MLEQCEPVKNDQRYPTLHVDDHLGFCENALKEVLKCADDVATMVPENYLAKRKAGEKAMSEFKIKFKKVTSLRESIMVMKGKSTRQQAADKRKNRTARKKVRQVLMVAGSSEEIAEFVAGRVTESSVGPFDYFNLTSTFKEGSKTLNKISPVILNNNVKSEGLLSKEFGNFFNNNKEKCIAKIPSGIKQLGTSGRTFATSTLSKLPPVDWNTCTTKVYECTDEFQPYLNVQGCYATGFDYESMPLAGLATSITVVVGYGFVFMIDLRRMLELGFGIQRTQAYLESMSQAELVDVPHAGVQAGATVIVPFGWIPVVIGIPVDEEGHGSDYLSCLVNVALDKKGMLDASPDVRIEVKAYLRRSLQRKCNLFNDTNKKAIQALLSLFPKNDVLTVAEDDGSEKFD